MQEQEISDQKVIRWLNTFGLVINLNDPAGWIAIPLAVNMFAFIAILLIDPRIIGNGLLVLSFIIASIVGRIILSKCLNYWIIKTLKTTEPDLVRAAIQYLIDHNSHRYMHYNTPEDNLRELIEEYAERAGISN